MRLITVHVFYAEQLLSTIKAESVFMAFRQLRGGVAPDGAYLLVVEHPTLSSWYRSDFTPVLPVDVPKPYKLLELLLT